MGSGLNGLLYFINSLTPNSDFLDYPDSRTRVKEPIQTRRQPLLSHSICFIFTGTPQPALVQLPQDMYGLNKITNQTFKMPWQIMDQSLSPLMPACMLSSFTAVVINEDMILQSFKFVSAII